ncbi:TonB-dependent receptor [Sunxiuqinia sp. A32]|uniref:TonB-dependent receptor n=1 Tax=Sunxiuqinia sp. A32 TaxID=3461496 RepID=UPI0040454533
MIRNIVFGIILLVISLNALAQENEIKIDVHEKPLNTLLIELRDHYNIRLSYSDNELSRFKVTVRKTFQNSEEALKYLLHDLPFQLKKSNDVFIIIFDKKKAEKEFQNTVNISGQIVESGTYEPLSFSSILINKQQLFADASGSFNYTASADSSFDIRISHLGYYILDTVLYEGRNQKIVLTPSVENLPEVTVQNSVVEKAAIIGEKPGNMKLNHNISRFLAGQGDNSVFNLLKLMPGIQAANEQTTDIQIWGSYEGQSLISFDDFTLFGLKNYNSNISIVNPSVVKNIEIYKGGFEAKYGDRVGGLVSVYGKNGSLKKPTFSFNINPMTINGMVELPLFKTSSLLFAYRQTYYNPYSQDDFKIFGFKIHERRDRPEPNPMPGGDVNLNVFPEDYQFRDMNLKYTFNFDNSDQISFSGYYGGDDFKLITTDNLVNPSFENNPEPFKVSFSDLEKNEQLGLSLNYLKNWGNGNLSKLIFSHSDYSKNITDSIHTVSTNDDVASKSDVIQIKNEASETSLHLNNTINIYKGHQIEFGAGVFVNKASIRNRNTLTDTLAVDDSDEFENKRGMFFIQDNLPLPGKITLRTGLRINLPDNLKKAFIEPRISFTSALSDNLKLNASWGLYNQFVYKTAYVDRDRNFTYLWAVSDENSKVLNATHWNVGLNYYKSDFTFNVDGYFKTIKNLSRYKLENPFVNGEMKESYNLYSGDSKTYGIDFYMKKDFKKHAIWGTYTLSKVLERLAPANSVLPRYMLAPQDQRHELKLAGLFNIGKFYLSANYIYGSGLNILKEQYGFGRENISYKRLDAAMTYKFNWKKLSGETGISIINLLNTRNLVSNNIRNIDYEFGSIKISSDALPFTPIVFLKLTF